MRCGGKRWHKVRKGGCGGAVYFLGFIGAAIYYIQHSSTFWAGVVGVLKAVVWPAFLAYHILAYFGM